MRTGDLMYRCQACETMIPGRVDLSERHASGLHANLIMRGVAEHEHATIRTTITHYSCPALDGGNGVAFYVGWRSVEGK